MIEDIWGFDFEGNERTLDVHVNRLRDRFPEERSGFKITTIRGLGYRLEVRHEATRTYVPSVRFQYHWFLWSSSFFLRWAMA